MPLRFRSVVPYTLPGILALIGWWWYISRKKDRVVGRDRLEGAPSAVSLRPSPTEGSNGLIEKGRVSPTNDTEKPESPSHRGGKRLEHESNAHVTIEGSEEAPLLEKSIKENVDETLKGDKENVENDTSQQNEVYVSETDRCEELILSVEFTKGTSSAPESGHISGAERPEPEGEVAKRHDGAINTQDELAVCAVSSVQRAVSQSALETPISVQDFHQNVLTSTPSLPVCAASYTALTQDFTPPSVIEENQPNGGSVEPDWELLAAGLITEVISAATQEVLGVTSCQVTDNTRICSQEMNTTAHQLPPEKRFDVQKSEKVWSNGCSSDKVWDSASQRLHWLAQAAQPQLPVGEVMVLAEDSACSTCHSEISSEDLHQTDNIQVTELSSREPEERQMEKMGDGAEQAAVSALSDDGSVDVMCDLKRLNGMGLGNGAHKMGDTETDQSGGSDVNSMDSVDSGCIGESQSNHAALSSSEVIIWEIEVPKHLVGRLIGKQGRYVSFLKQSSGAKIYISTLPYTQEFQICHIEGAQQQVDKALLLIGKKFKDLDMANLYAPPAPPLTLPSLPMTSWLLLPSGVTVEVIIVNIVSAGHVFVQQHTHPTYHALRSLDQQMFLCYSQPGTPALPSPAEVGVICAAPAVEGAWWRAQVITFYKENNEVEIRYVDYGGYDRVKINTLRQIRSDFVTLPFQGAEVLLDNIAPLPGEDSFSAEATSALEEMTRGVALLAQVSNYDNNTGLPLVHLWNMVGEEVVSVNRTLAERGLGVWVDSF